MDARVERTAAALRTAVLALAEHKDIDTVSVAELAREAGINRVTFYDHASSPSALLDAVLMGELDAVRQRYLADANVERVGLLAAVGQTTTAVASAVGSHAAIYRRMIERSGGTSLHSILGRHFESTVRQLIGTGLWHLPALPFDDPDHRAAFTDSLSKYIAFGAVGALEVWLLRPEPRNPAEFAETCGLLLPNWLMD